MGMKERREARWQNLFGQFVSVKGLINYFANEEGLDISDVAAELEGVIKSSDDSVLPEFGSIDPAGVVFVPWSGEVDCRSHLMDWLSDTIMGCGHGDASDFHGWMRDDLFPFLRLHQFDVNSDFPPWAPSSEIARVNAQSETATDFGGDRASQIQNVDSAIFHRLLKSIEIFPDHFPGYEIKAFKLEAEIDDWLVKKVKLAINTRETSVFRRIITEHFKLSTDSPKSK